MSKILIILVLGLFGATLLPPAQASANTTHISLVRHHRHHHHHHHHHRHHHHHV